MSLQAFRQAIANKSQIALVDDDGKVVSNIEDATQIRMGKDLFSKEELTLFADDKGDRFSIAAVYYAYIKKGSSHAEYFSTCMKLGLKTVSLVSKKELFAYLDGEIELDFGGDVSVKRAADDSGVEHDSNKHAKLETTTAQALKFERVIQDRVSVLCCAHTQVKQRQ
jgi:hypothetical protein